VTLAAARADPTGFVAALEPMVVIDEIQRGLELLLDIEASIVRERPPGRFLLTGSADVLLPQVADSLAGRMEVLTLWLLSGAEIAGYAGFKRADALFDAPSPS
jgi:predicted AAA+ superfamily ATPase